MILLQAMSYTSSLASEIEVLFREGARAARLTQDLMAPMQELVIGVPDELLEAPEWDRHLVAMREWLGAANALKISIGPMTSTFGAATAVIANTCTASLSVFSSGSASVQIEAVERAKTRFDTVLGRSDLLGRVRSSMSRLGIESQGRGYRSPTEQLDEAHAALKNPPLADGHATSILIPLRQCINGCLGVLLKRREEQEPAQKKILALGSQCGQAGLPTEHFGLLQENYDSLWKRLSTAKDADLSRHQIMLLFNEALTFLDALLSSVDEGRLKPKT